MDNSPQSGPDGQGGTRLGPRSVELAQAEEVGSWSAWRWMRCSDGGRSMTAAPASIVRKDRSNCPVHSVIGLPDPTLVGRWWATLGGGSWTSQP